MLIEVSVIAYIVMKIHISSVDQWLETVGLLN
jgi:hypothetical protein